MGFNDEFKQIKKNDAIWAMRNEISEVFVLYSIVPGKNGK